MYQVFIVSEGPWGFGCYIYRNANLLVVSVGLDESEAFRYARRELKAMRGLETQRKRNLERSAAC
jgi:hypothetical protein